MNYHLRVDIRIVSTLDEVRLVPERHIVAVSDKIPKRVPEETPCGLPVGGYYDINPRRQSTWDMGPHASMQFLLDRRRVLLYGHDRVALFMSDNRRVRLGGHDRVASFLPGLDSIPIWSLIDHNIRKMNVTASRIFGFMDDPLRLGVWNLETGELLQSVLIQNRGSRVASTFIHLFEPHLLTTSHAVLLSPKKVYVVALATKQARQLRMSSSQYVKRLVDVVERHDGCLVGATNDCVFYVWNVAKSMIPQQTVCLALGGLRFPTDWISVLPDGQYLVAGQERMQLWISDGEYGSSAHTISNGGASSSVSLFFTKEDDDWFVHRLAEIIPCLPLVLFPIIVAFSR